LSIHRPILSRRRTPLAWLAVLLLLGLPTACSDLARNSPMSHARTSPEALARAALDALEAEDEEALKSLMITREEYLDLLWPSLPDREYVPFDFVWSITGPRSRKARRQALQELGGLPLELVKVDLGDDVEVYDDFTLHQEARMTVRRTDTGAERVIPLMDVLVEMEGGWKFLNFGEDL
jgi:hypothetical protein